MNKLRLRASAFAVVAMSVLIPVPASAAEPADSPARPSSVELVPAWSKDLPAGEAQMEGATNVPVQRAITQAAPAWVCTVYSSDPRKSGVFVEGDGSQFCSGTGYAATKITVRLQRSRWYGWQTMRTESTSWGSARFLELVDVAYDCSGDGTYTYRMVTTGYANGGAYSQSVQSLNYLRVRC